MHGHTHRLFFLNNQSKKSELHVLYGRANKAFLSIKITKKT